ncbi:TPA: phosphatidylglycerophosphatase A [Vibrio vulnificus]|uniref:phosphatidylglycerophosphatase A family protein n=1 Tax=Vibrio vulnificus TaxID=672 RepID=UPI0006AD211F|nr:phosphatidylglycerophosphatase A [Vibrio vulnificus]HDY8064379.1 phosphatidylglycerophosphatase A [Vibrio vulnificus]
MFKPSTIVNLATGFGLGRHSRMPGTWGTLLGLPLYLWLSTQSPYLYLLSVTFLYFFGVRICSDAAKALKDKDPGIVVFDEAIGFLLALIWVPNNAIAIAIAFTVFRCFDIAKPFPIRWVESRLTLGHAIMLDDIVAGIYTLLFMHILVLPAFP